MKFRKACESDLNSIFEIEQKSMTMAWSYKSFEEALKAEYTMFYVCEIDSAIAGFGILYVTAPEAELPDIVVSEEFRGQGIGKKLLSKLLEDAKANGVLDFFLEVRDSNIPAQKLYEGFGFERTGVRKKFYRDPVEDAICMHLSADGQCL